MIERRKGAIVNVVSIAGHNGGGPGAGAYASSRPRWPATPSRWPRSSRRTACASTAVAPGVIDTPFHEAFSTPEMLKNFVAAIPLDSSGREECATVIAFLASSAASYILGETININGGQLMR